MDSGDELKEYKRFYGSGELMEHEFSRNGVREGEYKSWYRNGQLWTHGFYQNGLLCGKSKSWYENGQLMSISYFQDGKNQGKCMNWYRDSHPWYQNFYKDGIMCGEVKYWQGNRTGKLYFHNFHYPGETSVGFSFSVKMACLDIKHDLFFQKSDTSSFLISDLLKMI